MLNVYLAVTIRFLVTLVCVGFESYNDKSDEPRQKELLRWLKKNPQECLDVDVVCSQKTLSKIFQAPYTEATATPWEVKVTRGPDGICYVEEE